MSFAWYGSIYQARAVAAAKAGIDTTMAQGVVLAKARVPVRTGLLQGSLRFQPAQLVGSRVVGWWGSFDVHYAIYVELGTSRMRAQPYLLPASVAAYRGLADSIRRAYTA